MISKLDDNVNTKLLNLLKMTLGISAKKITLMSDHEVLAIFDKLAFQHRQGIGVFENYGGYVQERNDIDYIQNELANLELLR